MGEGKFDNELIIIYTAGEPVVVFDGLLRAFVLNTKNTISINLEQLESSHIAIKVAERRILIMSYVSPNYNKSAFDCPNCGVYAEQKWSPLCYEEDEDYTYIVGYYIAQCSYCEKCSLWEGNDKQAIMVYPASGTAPLANQDMPIEIMANYEEARKIAGVSPRSAAALLRLAVQKLCAELGEKGLNINEDIASLVKKGLPERIKQSLDIVRVIGNNAVHPGQIDLDDDPDIAIGLFSLVNLIVEFMISQNKHVEAMYSALPESARLAIEKRDAKT